MAATSREATKLLRCAGLQNETEGRTGGQLQRGLRQREEHRRNSRRPRHWFIDLRLFSLAIIIHVNLCIKLLDVVDFERLKGTGSSESEQLGEEGGKSMNSEPRLSFVHHWQHAIDNQFTQMTSRVGSEVSTL